MVRYSPPPRGPFFYTSPRSPPLALPAFSRLSPFHMLPPIHPSSPITTLLPSPPPTDRRASRKAAKAAAIADAALALLDSVAQKPQSLAKTTAPIPSLDSPLAPSYRVATWNAASLSPQKLDALLNIMIRKRIDLVAVTETASPPGLWRYNRCVAHISSPTDSPSAGIAIILNPAHVDARAPLLVFPGGSPGRSVWFAWRGILHAALYLPPAPKSDPDRLAILLDGPPGLPTRLPRLFLGDLNARLGFLTGDSTTNPRGAILAQYLARIDYTPAPPQRPHPTFFGAPHGGCSVVDLFILSPAARPLWIKTRVTPNHLGSDHFLVLAEFALPPPPKPHQ